MAGFGVAQDVDEVVDVADLLAAQLAAASLVAEDDPASWVFVCLDERLAIAAENEGFRILE